MDVTAAGSTGKASAGPLAAAAAARSSGSGSGGDGGEAREVRAALELEREGGGMVHVLLACASAEVQTRRTTEM
jgi:hypothetical protein